MIMVLFSSIHVVSKLKRNDCLSFALVFSHFSPKDRLHDDEYCTDLASQVCLFWTNVETV